VDEDVDAASCNGCGVTCAAGESCCSKDGCRDLQSDERRHCGECGERCGRDRVCIDGQCIRVDELEEDD
jgi:hypothetical protein